MEGLNEARMLKFFDSKEVDAFADRLVGEMLKRYPPEGVDTDPKKATQRFRKVHDSLMLEVRSFTQKQALNFYTKARLGNRIRWAMREAGYPRDFADEFGHEVTTVVSVGGKK
jgi:hypothetical protein